MTELVLQYLRDSGQVVQVRADKDEWFDRYDGEAPALVFCDADHFYEPTVKDIEFALRVGAQVICGHDYAPEHSGTMQAVDDHGGYRALKGSVWVLSAPERFQTRAVIEPTLNSVTSVDPPIHSPFTG